MPLGARAFSAPPLVNAVDIHILSASNAEWYISNEIAITPKMLKKKYPSQALGLVSAAWMQLTEWPRYFASCNKLYLVRENPPYTQQTPAPI